MTARTRSRTGCGTCKYALSLATTNTPGTFERNATSSLTQTAAVLVVGALGPYAVPSQLVLLALNRLGLLLLLQLSRL